MSVIKDKWGIALAGGGTRGAYHIGVWKALQELGFEFEAVVGTSIGSVNAALFVQGDFEIACNIWENIKIENVLDIEDTLFNDINLLDYKNLKTIISEIIKKDGLQTKPFEDMLRAAIDEEKLRNSKIKYGLNTASVSEIEIKELYIDDIPDGQVVDSIMASSCFPGFQKRYIDEKAYRDGGIMDNLPLDMLFKLGLKNIIAVDVAGYGVKKIPKCLDANIIYIRCKKPQLGIFEFDRERILKSIKQGYYDTYKALGRLTGDEYYFNTLDYAKMRLKYSDELLKGVEVAASIFGIESIAVYKIEKLIDGVVERYMKIKDKNPKSEISIEKLVKITSDNEYVLIRLVNLILEGKTDALKLMSGVFGNKLQAAESIAYFFNNR